MPGMNLLAIDVGNSSTKLGFFRDGELLITWRFATETRRSSDEYGVLVVGMLNQRFPEGWHIDATVIACVVPRMEPLLDEMCSRYLGVTAEFLGRGCDVGIEMRVDNPELVGVDRLADVMAGLHLFGSPLITIDLGTHTVLNAIARDGAFIGGAIAPGLNTVLEATVRSSPRLPPIDLDIPPQAIGANTVHALQSGLVLGYAAMVDGLVHRFWREMGQCQVVATGGYARLVTSLTDIVEEVCPDLTLQGLRLAHDYNAGGKKE